MSDDMVRKGSAVRVRHEPACAGEKLCTGKCGRMLTVLAFDASPHNLDGMRGECRECRSARAPRRPAPRGFTIGQWGTET